MFVFKWGMMAICEELVECKKPIGPCQEKNIGEGGAKDHSSRGIRAPPLTIHMPHIPTTKCCFFVWFDLAHPVTCDMEIDRFRTTLLIFLNSAPSADFEPNNVSLFRRRAYGPNH